MKICAVGADLFLADGQTDIMLTVAFRNFSNAPNNACSPVPQHVQEN